MQKKKKLSKINKPKQRKHTKRDILKQCTVISSLVGKKSFKNQRFFMRTSELFALLVYSGRYFLKNKNTLEIKVVGYIHFLMKSTRQAVT